MTMNAVDRFAFCDSRLPLLAALCIGIAVGALGISALQSQPRAASVERRPADLEGGQIERMVASIEAQAESLTRLCSRWTGS